MKKTMPLNRTARMSGIDVLAGMQKTLRSMSEMDPGNIERKRVFFPNGYGLSIISGRGTYCGPGTFEVAVIKGTGESDWHLCYGTPITDDVLSYQTPADIKRLEVEVSKLKKGKYA